MRIESPAFGSLEVDQEAVLTLPSGLIGLPEKRRFVLVEHGAGSPLGWLLCVDDPAFGVPVADPAIFRSDYRIAVPQAEVAELALRSVDDAAILVVTTIAPGGTRITGNLRAPILVNVGNRTGRQVVLDRPDLGYRTPVDPIALASAAGRLELSVPVGASTADCR